MLKMWSSAVFLFFLLIFPTTSFQKSDIPESRDIDVGFEVYQNRIGVAKSEFLIEMPPTEFWKVFLQQVDHWSEFVPDVLFCRIISKEKVEEIVSRQVTSWDEVYEIVKGEELPLNQRVYRRSPYETTYYKLLYMNLPWPVRNRWVLQKEDDVFDPKTGAYSRRFVLVVGDVVIAEGYWKARPHPTNANWSLIYYENTYSAGFQIPSFIFKPLARSTTRSILEAVRQRAELAAHR